MLTTLIEKYLLAIDQATFQKMMNHVLHLEGYKFLGSPGSVIGKNKTSKGSPDSFFEHRDGYAFCEFTTQEKLEKGESFFNKLKKDIEHCFDVATTNIPKDQISTVILAFNQEVSVGEHNDLKKLVAKHNKDATLVIYSIQEIPFRLIYFPGVAEKYIPGIKTSKGALTTLPDFLKITENGLQPSLTNPFNGRENEISEARKYLLTNDVLILTGSQGVGKSKLAVQLAEIFESEYGYEPRVIVNNPVPLWDDLTDFIFPSKKYFIFFDDANKTVKNLDYLIGFLKGREKNSTKVVLTVRDYVRLKLNEFLVDIPYSEMIIKSLDDKQLSEIVHRSLPEGSMLEPPVMERVLALAKGNSRLALMATSSILTNNNVEILKNVFSLYNQYFQKVKNDVSLLGDPENLKALGILSFFGVMNRASEETKKVLETNFKIGWNDLWERYVELEKAELVDLYHDEIVKLSDQVLATYVFYKTFIDEDSAVINYSKWLLVFLEHASGKVNSSLVDLINTFGYHELKDRITSLILEVQKELENDKQKLYGFLTIFWFCREVDTLLFVRDEIDALEDEMKEPEKINYTFEPNDFIFTPGYLNLIVNFWGQTTPFIKEALELIKKLIFKQPSRIPEILKHLGEQLTFSRYDIRDGFIRQLTFLEVFSDQHLTQHEKLISDRVFLSIAPAYLGWEFHQTQGKGNGSMMIYNFTMARTDQLMELRKKILERLFSLFPDHENTVLDCMQKYVWQPRVFDSAIYQDEQSMVTSFFTSQLDPANHAHCHLVSTYIETLSEHHLSSDPALNTFQASVTMELSKLFGIDYDDLDTDYDTQQQNRKNKIQTYIAGKDIASIERMLIQLDAVYRAAAAHNDAHSIDSSMPLLLIALVEQDTRLYEQTLELIMNGNFAFEMNYGNFIFFPLQNGLLEPSVLYRLLNRYEYRYKQVWKYIFFDALQQQHITEFFLNEFLGFLSSVSNRFYCYNLHSFVKFDTQFALSKNALHPSAQSHDTIVTYICKLLLSKTTTVEISFDQFVCQRAGPYFSGHVDLLKRLFYHQKNNNRNYDHSGREIAAVSAFDNYFVAEFIRQAPRPQNSTKINIENIDLSFVWDYSDHQAIVGQALEVIIEKVPHFINFEHQACVLFKKLAPGSDRQASAHSFISDFIANNFAHRENMRVIFNVIVYCFSDKILAYLRELLMLNKDIAIMQDLWLEKNQVIVGSRVPRIESHITFLKSVIEMVKSMPDPLSYAGHINRWERELEYAKKEKQEVLKRDFLDGMD